MLGGGGTRGAYQAGALWGMLHATDDLSKYKYDVVTGVSAGTINGAAFSTFPPGEEIKAAEVLSETWQDLTSADIYKMWWPFGLIQGLNEPGMVNTAPLRNFIKKFFDRTTYEFKRKTAFLGVDASNGDIISFNETLSDNDKINAVMTSSAIPVGFTTQHWSYEGKTIAGVDGGTAYMFDIASGIKRCHELVDDDSKITVDVIGCFGADQPPYTGF